MMVRKRGHRFAEKKMKRMLTMISALLICASGLCQQRCAIGTDIGRIIQTSGINISAGLGFTEKWSVSWMSEMDFTPLYGKKNNEYLEHLSQTDEVRTKEKVFQNNSIAFQYWVSRPYEGAYLETGIQVTNNTKAGHILGFGYFMPICNGIRSCVSYRCSSGLSFGIYWTI